MAKRRLILIDLAGIFRANWASMGDLEVSEALHRTVERVHQLSAGYDLCAVCCDWPPYKRAKLHPEYKAHRTTPTQVMVEQYRRTKERLTAEGYLLWQVDGYEADDCLATAVQYAKRDELDVTVASSDKDLLCLVDDEANVRQLVTSTGEVFRRLEVVQKFGVPPQLIPDLLALMGDKSDNIPGIPGVGVKTAAGLLRDFGNAENVLACAESIKGKVGENVRAHGIERLKLALSLVRLETDVPIDWDAIYVERKATPVAEEEDNMNDNAEEPFEDEEPSSPHRDALPPEPMPQPPKQTQLARREPEPDSETQSIVPVRVEYNQALEPQTMGQAYKLARGLFESRLYSRFPNPEAIWAVIMRGREMGIGALTALDVFHNFQGRPMMSAHLIIAKAKADPECEYFQCIETTPERATWRTKNRNNPKPTDLTYTIEQAKSAGLLRQGGNWAQRPDEMLRKTCGVQLARMEYPRAAMGMYCPEEVVGDVAA